VNIENHVTCSFKSLKIYGGENENAPKLVELCYSDKPVVYTSPGNKLFITYDTNPLFTLRGFKATYKSIPLQCGGKFTVNSGIIHTQNYPLNYPHNQNCEWLLEVDKNHLVNLTFEDFDIENSRNCTDDYVKIFDGPSKEDYLMGTHCRNGIPPSYVSTSNQMLVVMRSDSIVSAKGFKATYKTACGARIIVKDQGFISGTSKNLDKNIINCTWILAAENPADHVTLTFTDMGFNLPHLVDTCSMDYVQVIEGDDMNGPVLGKWCKNKIPPPITSTGSALVVHLFAVVQFHSEFSATYSVLNSACGGNYTSEHGSIASPNYPNSYPLNSECIWILNTSPGNRISITFKEFNIQKSDNCNLDYLEIREDNGIGKLLGVFCGQEIEQITSSNKLWIKFKSDAESSAQGFLADYSFLGGNELYGPMGRITSPLYPKLYRNSATFWWRITVEVGYIIRLEFKEVYILNIVSSCAYTLKIFDGYNSEAPILLKQCSSIKPESIDTSSNVAYIEMNADLVLFGNKFDLNWLQIPKDIVDQEKLEKVKISKCTEEVALMSNINDTYRFSSPGWPNGYEDNLECTWIFTSPPGTHLSITINAMNLEESDQCTFDYVAIYAGNALTSTDNTELKGKLCLSNATWNSIKTKNIMTVKFITDSYTNKTGFSAKVTREGKYCPPLPATTETTLETIGNKLYVRAVGVGTHLTFKLQYREKSMSCGGDYKISTNDNELLITSPNYPNIPHPYTECIWKIMATDGERISIHFVDRFDLASSPKDGGLEDSLSMGRYCKDVAPSTMTTKGNMMYIKFYTDIPEPNNGFKAVISSGDACGGILRGTQGTLSSPDYPQSFPKNLMCVWWIIGPVDHTLKIQFRDLHLPTRRNCKSADYLDITEQVPGNETEFENLGTYCGTQLPDIIHTTYNEVLITFVSDSRDYLPFRGFSLNFTSSHQVCGGVLTAMNGIIKSPGYPNLITRSRYCDWRIELPLGFQVLVDILDLDTIDRSFSRTFSLSFYNDFHMKSRIQTIMSNVDIPQIRSSSNKMMIGYWAPIGYRGFKLRYSASALAPCGGILSNIGGEIKPPAALYNMSTYLCEWLIKPPDFMINSANDTGLTLTLKATGNIGRCYYYDSIALKDIGKICGNITKPKYLRSPLIENKLTILNSSTPVVKNMNFNLMYEWKPCGGILQGPSHTITEPKNWTSSYPISCAWHVKYADTGEMIHLTFSKFNLVRNCDTAYIIVRNGGPTSPDFGSYCGNIRPPDIISTSNQLWIEYFAEGPGPNEFEINLKLANHGCGGALRGFSREIASPK
ncbi:hypothetical protein M0802_016189, partial [Mischocyttarus mexicanus]